MEQIAGQMSLEDFLPDQGEKKPDKWRAVLPSDRKKKRCGEDNIPCAWKPEFAPCETCERETVPKGDCGTCKYSFWKHGKGGTKRGCQYHGGKDGCHYERRLTCRTCSHMRQSVCGLGDIYHGFGCFGFGISKSEDIHKEACGDYEEATDGEAWRTSDAAVKEWIGYER